MPVTAADLTDPSSAASLLTRLLNDRTQVEQGYFPRWSGNARLVDAWVSNLQNPQPGSDASEASYADVYVDSAALEELLTAVRSDLAAGRLGVRYLLDDQARQENCYLSDLYLDFRTPPPGTRRKTARTNPARRRRTKATSSASRFKRAPRKLWPCWRNTASWAAPPSWSLTRSSPGWRRPGRLLTAAVSIPCLCPPTERLRRVPRSGARPPFGRTRFCPELLKF